MSSSKYILWLTFWTSGANEPFNTAENRIKTMREIKKMFSACYS
jgi:hypothetical protein